MRHSAPFSTPNGLAPPRIPLTLTGDQQDAMLESVATCAQSQMNLGVPRPNLGASAPRALRSVRSDLKAGNAAAGSGLGSNTPWSACDMVRDTLWNQRVLRKLQYSPPLI